MGELQYSHYICDTLTASLADVNSSTLTTRSNGNHTLGYDSTRTDLQPSLYSATVTNDADRYNTFYCDLPQYFISSRNANKEIQVLICRVYDLENDCEIQSSMHSDIAMINASADSYIAATNTLYPVPKRYRIGDNRSTFKIWFRDVYGQVISLSPTKTRAVVELVLVY